MLALWVTALLLGGDAGIPWPPSAEGQGNSACTKALPDSTRSLLGQLLDADAVDKAEGVLGPAPVHQEGDASNFERWRCWQAANGDGTVLRISAGEVGARLRIQGPEMAFADRSACAKSAKVSRQLATGNGLRLGQSVAELERTLGTPTKTGRDLWERACVQSGAFKAHGQSFDVASRVRAVTRSGKVVGLEVSWTVTN